MHVVQRGNNRQVVFFEQSDWQAYLDRMFECAERYEVHVHAYVCMSNHVHILMTPTVADAASRMMQRLGSAYAARINTVRKRTGSLWEGRFKSSIVDSDRYVLACYRYIELNPVRAGIVHDPGEYPWSSYRFNALGEGQHPVRPHPSWLALGADKAARRRRHVELVAGGMTKRQMERIRRGTRKGLPIGSTGFRAEIEATLGMKLGDGRRGRPRSGPKKGL